MLIINIRKIKHFKYVHNIFQSTYKSNLEGYTTQISADKNSEEYRKMEAQAARLAQEIEGSSTNKLAIELENGDEEEAFSAVVRNKGGTLHSGMNPSKIISLHTLLDTKDWTLIEVKLP